MRLAAAVQLRQPSRPPGWPTARGTATATRIASAASHAGLSHRLRPYSPNRSAKFSLTHSQATAPASASPRSTRRQEAATTSADCEAATP
jgi:hypothetical protein